MKLTLERAKLSATSGKNMIIECLETSHISRKAASESDVRYGFSGKRATRYVKIGGYLVSSAASAAHRSSARPEAAADVWICDRKSRGPDPAAEGSL